MKKELIDWLLTDYKGDKPHPFWNVVSVLFILTLVGFLLW
jgi:hypothetical protein